MSEHGLEILMTCQMTDHSPHAGINESIRFTVMGTLGVSRIVILERLNDLGGTTEADDAHNIEQPRLLPAIAGDVLMWHERWYASRNEEQRKEIWSLPQFERALAMASKKLSDKGELRSIYELFLESLDVVGEMGCSCERCCPKKD